jgi:hypothetical protein
MEKDMTERDVQLEAQIREIRTALIGIDGQNGLRGELRDFLKRYEARDGEVREWQKAVEDRWNNYIQAEREETCYGSARLDKYIKDEEKRRNERRQTDITAVEFRKAVTVALITSMASVIVAVLSIISK